MPGLLHGSQNSENFNVIFFFRVFCSIHQFVFSFYSLWKEWKKIMRNMHFLFRVRYSIPAWRNKIPWKKYHPIKFYGIRLHLVCNLSKRKKKVTHKRTGCNYERHAAQIQHLTFPKDFFRLNFTLSPFWYFTS